MKRTHTPALLYTFAAIEFVIAILMFTVFHNVAIGGSSVALGGSLIAIATATRKKLNNG